MNHNPDIADNLTVSDLEIIDQVCTHFEKQWRTDDPPSIEQQLSGHVGPVRKSLVTELIKLDIDYRQSTGQTPVRQEYLSRFPDDIEAIEMAFADDSWSIGDSLKLSRTRNHAADQPPVE